MSRWLSAAAIRILYTDNRASYIAGGSLNMGGGRLKGLWR